MTRLCIIFLFFRLSISAQFITIVIKDEAAIPIEFANVVLYVLPDSTLITGTVTDKNGEAKLKYEKIDSAFIRISHIGFETQDVPVVSGQTIVLKVLSSHLNDIEIKGTLPAIRLRDDALVTTVQNSVLSKAGTANDVLKRLPSVTDDKGVYSVFGRGEAKIYINNREMRDVSELDNLNSADIKDVEIVNNPGARYDASVKAVIRINTVRKVGDGFSFDVRSSYYQSQNIDLREQLNMNYRKNGWDVFGTLSYSRNEWIQDSKLQQKTYVDTLWTQNNTLYSNGYSNTLMGIAGVNYEISSKHYAGMKYTLSVFPSNRTSSTMNSTVLANGGFYDKWDSREEKISENKPAHRLNAYYNGSFEDLKVDFNTDYYANKQFSRSLVSETSQEYDSRTVISENNVSNRLMASKLVLSYPVFGGQLSLGNEYNNTHRKDEYRNEQNIVPSSNTTIKEQNNNFFIEYSRAISIGQLKTGLRYENVRSDYFDNDIKMDEQSRHYSQWFPNFSFSTRLNEVNLQLSYTAKTRRPTYRQLSSNVFYGNRFTLQTGNPFLEPSVIHDVTLVGTWKFLQLMVSYKHEKDAIIYWAQQQEENPAVTLLAYRNLEKLPAFTGFLMFSPKFGIWSPQLSGGFVKQWVTIESNNKPVHLNKPMPMASFNNSLSLPKEFLLTLDMNYQGRGHVQNIYLTENRFRVTAGIAKSFFKDHLSITVKGHDLFKGNKVGNLLYDSQMEMYQLNRYDSQEFELTVRYKFNSAKSKYKGTGAGEEEINRLK